MRTNGELIKMFIEETTQLGGYRKSISIDHDLDLCLVPAVVKLNLKQKCILSILMDRGAFT